ncbi:outer membrane beta-barrel protein, partial [Helicobacter pylori]
HGVINGFGIQVGYKQFFGNKRNIGLRYYAFFDYGFTQLGSLSSAVKANIFTYGAGTDFLWNIFRRVFSDQSLNVGVFGGIQIAG